MTVTDAIGPQQINRITETLVTVRANAAGDVYSVQPNGEVQTRPIGTAGPFELAILKPDRLIYAPEGPYGRAFIVPYCDAIPNA